MRRPCVLAILAALSILVLGAGLAPARRPWLTYNATQSAPLGFYATEPPQSLKVGDLVLSRLPPAITAFADGRRYVPATVAVLKPITALTAAVVCRWGPMVALDGRPLVVARTKDRFGRPLPIWRGCRRLTPDQVFLLSTRHAASFDGRYFGPTSRALILAKVHPLWTW